MKATFNTYTRAPVATPYARWGRAGSAVEILKGERSAEWDVLRSEVLLMEYGAGVHGREAPL